MSFSWFDRCWFHVPVVLVQGIFNLILHLFMNLTAKGSSVQQECHTHEYD